MSIRISTLGSFLREITLLFFCLSQILLDESRGVSAQHLACDNRRPEGHSPEKRDGDGGFRIIVDGVHATRGLYAPNQVYTVTIQGLTTRYSTQKFTEFLLVAESEKQAMMGPTGLVTTGILHIIDDSQTRFSDTCPDGVTSVNRQPKSEVSMLWTAPSVLVASCITFKATVVERPHVWYMDDGQLTKTICPEFQSKGKEMPPSPLPQLVPILETSQNNLESSGGRNQRLRHVQNQALPNNNANHAPSTAPRDGRRNPPPTPQIPPSPPQPTVTPPPECCACDEAKYEVIFEGIWSKETHPKDFPENEWLLHFSDIIGASHSPNYFVWKTGEVASEGIRQVAEWGATRHLENELKAQSRNINTIIKARGLWHPNERGKTSAAFRVDRNHHLMSLVSMIGPSPDWLVGISGLELCMKNCTWLEETQLDLYPYDAGTDSGITYMSPNTPTEPRDKIRALTGIDPNDARSPFYDPEGKDPMQPFATVSIRRQRIYPKSCDDTSHTSDASHEVHLSENTEDINRPECGVAEWTSWSACSVTCGKGLRMRKRNYVLFDKAEMMGCDRQLVEKEMCLGELATCPPDEGNFIEEIESVCAVTQWSNWTSCSVTCGQGTRTRQRRYKNRMGRKKCHLETTQTERCEGVNGECDPNSQTEVDPDCVLTPWSEWSPCSVTCGPGFQLRSRRFLLPSSEETLPPQKCLSLPLTERAECIGDYGAECAISMEEAKELCLLPPETGPCRADFIRYAYNPEKQMCIPFSYGGCKGNRNRFETDIECNQVCGFLRQLPPGPPPPPNQFIPFPDYPPFEYTTQPPPPSIDQLHSTTTQQPETLTTQPGIEISYGAESEENFNLDLSIGNKLKKYLEETATTIATSTTIAPFSSSLIKGEGGAGRIESDAIVEPVEEVSRPPGSVDCVVSPWTPWSPCSATCGADAFMTRSRDVLVEPQNDGRRCPRKLKKKKQCRLPPC